jgi:hypothetical protein
MDSAHPQLSPWDAGVAVFGLDSRKLSGGRLKLENNSMVFELNRLIATRAIDKQGFRIEDRSEIANT